MGHARGSLRMRERPSPSRDSAWPTFSNSRFVGCVFVGRILPAEVLIDVRGLPVGGDGDVVGDRPNELLVVIVDHRVIVLANERRAALIRNVHIFRRRPFDTALVECRRHESFDVAGQLLLLLCELRGVELGVLHERLLRLLARRRLLLRLTRLLLVGGDAVERQSSEILRETVLIELRWKVVNRI